MDNTMNTDVQKQITGGVAEPFSLEQESLQEEATTVTSPDDMPMIVWLRGDEDYAEDFSLDADQAMKALGIKRSRLTQISGKELRVGRRRIGRYVRPVYRPDDIQAYKEWTRPTATHAKSSNLIEEAAATLRSQSELISQRYEDLLQKYTADITNYVAESFQSSYQTMHDLIEQKNVQVSENIQGLTTLFADLGGVIDRQKNQIQKSLHDLGLNQTRMKESLEHVLARQENVMQRQDQLKSELTAVEKFCQDTALEMKQLHAKFNDFSKKQEETTTNLAKIIKINLELQQETQKNVTELFKYIQEMPKPKDCRAPKPRQSLPPPRFK